MPHGKLKEDVAQIPGQVRLTYDYDNDRILWSSHGAGLVTRNLRNLYQAAQSGENLKIPDARFHKCIDGKLMWCFPLDIHIQMGGLRLSHLIKMSGFQDTWGKGQDTNWDCSDIWRDLRMERQRKTASEDH